MITALIITQTVVVGASTGFVMYKLSKFPSSRTRVKLVDKHKNGFKYYKAY